jgi:hypothetical protein
MESPPTPLAEHTGDPAPPDRLTGDERQFYIQGFRLVLKRFLRQTAIGWAVTTIGALCLLIFWRSPLPHGGFDLLLAMGAVVAGLAVVQTNLAALQSYVTVPFPDVPGRIPPAEMLQLRGWMQEVAGGGWRDAYAVLQRLEKIKDEQQGVNVWPTV